MLACHAHASLAAAHLTHDGVGGHCRAGGEKGGNTSLAVLETAWGAAPPRRAGSPSHCPLLTLTLPRRYHRRSHCKPFPTHGRGCGSRGSLPLGCRTAATGRFWRRGSVPLSRFWERRWPALRGPWYAWLSRSRPPRGRRPGRNLQPSLRLSLLLQLRQVRSDCLCCTDAHHHTRFHQPCSRGNSS